MANGTKSRSLFTCVRGKSKLKIIILSPNILYARILFHYCNITLQVLLNFPYRNSILFEISQVLFSNKTIESWWNRMNLSISSWSESMNLKTLSFETKRRIQIMKAYAYKKYTSKKCYSFFYKKIKSEWGSCFSFDRCN